MWEAFALQKFLSFFQPKYQCICDKVVKHLTSLPLNELVTGPYLLNLEDEVFPKWGLLLRNEFATNGSKFFSLWDDPNLNRRQQ